MPRPLANFEPEARLRRFAAACVRNWGLGSLLATALVMAGCAGPEAKGAGHATKTASTHGGKAGKGAGKAAGKRGGRKGRHGHGRPGGGRPGPGAGKAASVLAVRAVRLGPADIERRYRASATLLPQRKVEIRPLQSGIIVELGAEEGDRVKSGQMLVRLDDREIKLQAARDRVASDNARKEYERAAAAAKRAIATREEVERLEHALDSARAVARLSQHQVRQRTLHAPFSGTILARHADVGNLASSAAAVYELADLSQLELEVHVPEIEAAQIELEDPVALQLVDGTDFSGEVLRRAPIVDAFTGTVKFTIRAGSFPANAVPGAFVEASILLESRRSTPALPTSSVFDVEDRKAVFVVSDGRVARREVRLGLVGERFTEIVGGIEADDVVVLDGADLSVGTQVKPVLETSAADPGSAPARKSQ